jgi:hypothetical protein
MPIAATLTMALAKDCGFSARSCGSSRSPRRPAGEAALALELDALDGDDLAELLALRVDQGDDVG